ncbi:MAG: hypothetical protein OER78_08150 [Nitrosopumilus sp.]|nr:hypothetical protein [Nitrosopumilus sp.]MDH3854678.1 hypothetical protein [Nitrosopumilus sp.]
MTSKIKSLTGKIIIFLDGDKLFSVNGDFSLWKSKEKIEIPRKPPMQTEVKEFHTQPPSSQLKQINSKVMAKIEMRNNHEEEILCLFCYELLEPTRKQIVQDIVKIKQELLT